MGNWCQFNFPPAAHRPSGSFGRRGVADLRLSHTRRERLPLHEEPPIRAAHFPSPRAQGGSAIIFLCVLAYHLLVAIETTLQRQEIHTSWATVRDLLATHQIATIVLPTGQNGVLRIRRSATPEQDHRVLYEALGVPTEIIRPVKTWERTAPNND